MASIRQLPSGKWNIQVRHKGQKQISKTFNTKKEAEAYLKKLSRPHKAIPEAITQIASAHPQITIRDALRRYEKEISPKKKSYRTDVYRIRVILGTFLGEQLLHEIKPHHLTQYRDLRMSAVTGDTVNRELALLSHLFNIARIEWGYNDWLKDNPMRLVRKPRANKSRDRRR